METLRNDSTLREQQLAREALAHLTQVIAIKGADHVTLELADNHERLALPRKALELLALILSNMATGKTVSLLPTDEEVSTQEAADLLQVSRPHLVKLLEEGAMPFKKVGSHRRVLLAEVLRYEATQQAQRKQHLQFLAEQAQELNLGYE
ncbi:excisionase family DNA-binding protein [Hymenobacter sp. GOD-10R]|uniref:excisionase family DNA-binding protein n=1 Tax=Hymenobacter sp. GOD-10R TaxID=3093922 RepID=UPI002D7844BE|nr:excisionase family DNA-binding protein [Hymenobacter sp. GOD-10R]WRQ31695.1 excisionase family DNA-binding protein [Hymenobacter sp. GOD-10R]